jgi:formate hydrogenlyase subunit 3/multisubunit Na+/H+ antiporter MnhD subunit
MSNLLLAVGSFTIVAAVLAALVQHDFKKLLSFHAVSQVGYMLLGIGTGMPLGVAGGLLHMFNNAIYKSCLFLCGGAVEQECGTAELDKLGGLAKFMPITFTAFLIAALSISGIPPFNGFMSKWMIYQSLVGLSKYSYYWIIWLVAAMFGSAFTLASFVKLTHAIFLGQWSEATAKAKEAAWPMWLPALVLALLCVLFGVFAFELPLRYLIFPIVGRIPLYGIWDPGTATGLILIGLLLGLLFYWLGGVKKVTTKPAFIGGEILPEAAVKVSGVDFYDTVKGIKPLAWAYKLAARKWFDIYVVGANLVFTLSILLRALVNGALSTYLAWLFVGAMFVAYFLLR